MLNLLFKGKRVAIKYSGEYLEFLRKSEPESGFNQAGIHLRLNNREGVVKKIVFSSYRKDDCKIQVVVEFNTGSVKSAPILIDYIDFF